MYINCKAVGSGVFALTLLNKFSKQCWENLDVKRKEMPDPKIISCKSKIEIVVKIIPAWLGLKIPSSPISISEKILIVFEGKW